VRGLNAPPRSMVAPAFFTACAVLTICSRVSTEHGPAMTWIVFPPTVRLPTCSWLSSGFTSRLTSLNGCEMATASTTPGSTRNGSGSTAPLLPVMPMAVRVPPGIACGCQPRRRISSLTRSIS
jgi:hypothetical protein